MKKYTLYMHVERTTGMKKGITHCLSLGQFNSIHDMRCQIRNARAYWSEELEKYVGWYVNTINGIGGIDNITMEFIDKEVTFSFIDNEIFQQDLNEGGIWCAIYRIFTRA